MGKNWKIVFLNLLFLCFSMLAQAQTEIKGVILNNEGVAITNANIILTNIENDTEAFVFTKKDGSFVMKSNLEGAYNIRITSINYLPKNISVNLKKNSIIDLKSISMDEERTREIKEVVIKKSAITYKKDTVEYLAQKFATGKEMNVEELLKNIPDLKIDNNGKIMYKDTEVSSVMIENDDLFEKGYQTLTQNMPSDPIQKIQVLKNYSRNKLLKNLDNTGSIALNLLLKNKAKGEWLGSTTLASTSFLENKYQVRFNLMNFKAKEKFYLLYNSNNLGLNEMNGVNYLLQPSFLNSAENIGTDLWTFPLINLHQKNYYFSDLRTNFNNDQLASINYIHNFDNGWKLKTVGVFNKVANSNYTNSIYRFQDNTTSFTNTESKTWKQSLENWIGKIEFSKEFKNKSNLLFYNKISSTKENNNNEFVFDGTPNRQTADNKLFSTEHKLVYTKKLDSLKAFVGVARYLYQHRPYFFNEENDAFQSLIGDNAIGKIQQNLDTKMNFAGVKLSYLQSFSEENFIDIQLGNEYKKDVAKNELSLFTLSGVPLNIDYSPYNNHVFYERNNLFASAKYQYKKKEWKINLGLYNQLLNSTIQNDKQMRLAISPSFSIEFEQRKTGNFSFGFSQSYTSTGIKDVFVNYLYTGNRNFSQSDIGIQLFPSNFINFSYSKILFGWDGKLEFSYSKMKEYTSNNMIIQPKYAMSQSILLKGNEYWNSEFSAKRYLNFLKANFNILGGYSQSQYENSVNNAPLTSTRNFNYTTGFSLKSGWLKDFNFELGYEWKFRNIKSNINNFQYTDGKGYCNIYYDVNKNFFVESNLEYYKFGNTNQKSSLFWDVKLNYLMKAYKMNLFLKGNNLLNVKHIQSYSITNVSESVFEQQLLPTSVVVGLNKNF